MAWMTLGTRSMEILWPVAGASTTTTSCKPASPFSSVCSRVNQSLPSNNSSERLEPYRAVSPSMDSETRDCKPFGSAASSAHTPSGPPPESIESVQIGFQFNRLIRQIFSVEEQFQASARIQLNQQGLFARLRLFQSERGRNRCATDAPLTPNPVQPVHAHPLRFQTTSVTPHRVLRRLSSGMVFL